MPDENKEVKELQTRILNLESELAKFNKSGDESKASFEKIKLLESELSELRKERDELKSKIWDKKERRENKERRAVLAGSKHDIEPTRGEDDDSIGGPYA